MKGFHIIYERIKTQGWKVTALWLFSRGFSWITGVPLLHHSAITPFLYVGPQYNHIGLRHLKKAGIHAVVNMRREYDDAAHGLVWEEYCYLPTEDDDAPSLQQIEEGIRFIQKQELSDKKVYIHCGGGIGRAPTMAAAYLILQGYCLEDAVALIKRVRPFINITPIQLERLRECQVKFHAKNS